MIQLNLDSPIQFGKYKDRGLTVAALLEEDPKYLLWLRHRRYHSKAKGEHNDSSLGMSPQVHELLDVVLAQSPKLQATGYAFHLAKPTVEVTFPPQPEEQPAVERVAPAGWGAW